MEKVAILVGAVPVLAFLIDFLLSRSFLGYGYRIFVAPGVILHELSHAIACLLTGTKIHSISLFDKDGGSVEHQKSKIPFFGQLLISLAPFLVGIVAIYFFSRFVGVKQVNLTSITPSYESIRDNTIALLTGVKWHSSGNLVLVYLLFSVAVTMNPSKQDIKNIIGLVSVAAVVGFSVYRYTTFRPEIASHIPMQVILVLSTVVLMLILCLIFSIILFVLSKLIKPV